MHCAFLEVSRLNIINHVYDAFGAGKLKGTTDNPIVDKDGNEVVLFDSGVNFEDFPLPLVHLCQCESN